MELARGHMYMERLKEAFYQRDKIEFSSCSSTPGVTFGERKGEAGNQHDTCS